MPTTKPRVALSIDEINSLLQFMDSISMIEGRKILNRLDLPKDVEDQMMTDIGCACEALQKAKTSHDTKEILQKALE